MKKQILNFLMKKEMLKVLALLFITSYTPLIFELGRETQSQLTALELSKHFSLEANNLEVGKEINLEQKSISLQKVILAKATHIGKVKIEDLGDSYKDKILYNIHKTDENNPFAIRTLGKIITTKTIYNTDNILSKAWDIIKENTLEIFANFSIIEKAYAQTNFKWYGYSSNYQYTEKYIDENTVERTYDDGAILRYEMDNQGNSIPLSFRWINLPRN